MASGGRSVVRLLVEAVGHHCPAEHGDEDHECPAGKEVEDPDNPSDGSCEAVLGKRAIERVEETIVQLGRRLEAFIPHFDDVIGCYGCHIQSPRPDVDRSRLRKDLEDPDRTDWGGPRVAENRLVLAIDEGGMGGAGCNGPFSGGLVERGLDLATVAKASFVTTSDQDPPLLRRSTLRLYRTVESLLPVVQRQYVKVQRTGLSFSGSGSIVFVRVRELRSDIA